MNKHDLVRLRTTPIEAAENISHKRRNVLKAATGLAAMASVPIVSARAFPQSRVAVEKLQRSLELEFVDSKSIDGFVALGQVTLTNRSAQDMLLTDFAPAVVTTENASYDLAAHLKLQPLAVAAGQRLRFWVKPQTTTDQYGFARLVAMPESGRQRATEQIAGQSLGLPILAELDLTINSPRWGVDAIRQPVALKLEFPGQAMV